MAGRRNPNVYIGGRIHRKRLAGMGMGSILMNKGGAGAGSSYSDVDDYVAATGRTISAGSGLGTKLSKLVVKPLTKKPHNIRFEM
jgi:hypothetical protein